MRWLLSGAMTVSCWDLFAVLLRELLEPNSCLSRTPMMFGTLATSDKRRESRRPRRTLRVDPVRLTSSMVHFPVQRTLPKTELKRKKRKPTKNHPKWIHGRKPKTIYRFVKNVDSLKDVTLVRARIA